MYRYIIFDFDGTIADSGALVDKILDDLAVKNKFQGLSAKDFKHREGLTLSKKIQMLLFIRKVSKTFKERYKEIIPVLKPFEKMLGLLAAVHAAGYPLVIISSNTEANIKAFFRNHQFDLKMTVLSSEGLFGKHKAIKAFLKQCGCATGDVLYAGDEIRDINACHKAGIDIAFVTWGLDGKDDVSAMMPKFIIDDPDQLSEIVLNH
jgi:phosphoglycolate phosphatase